MVVVAAALTLRPRRRHTAMTMMMAQTPIQTTGTAAAKIIPMITPAEKESSAKQN
jgi:hypothetical protein